MSLKSSSSVSARCAVISSAGDCPGHHLDDSQHFDAFIVLSWPTSDEGTALDSSPRRYVMRIQLTIPKELEKSLRQLAILEHRYPRQQAEVLLYQAIQRAM